MYAKQGIERGLVGFIYKMATRRLGEVQSHANSASTQEKLWRSFLFG